jgi:hypothetical protein
LNSHQITRTANSLHSISNSEGLEPMIKLMLPSKPSVNPPRLRILLVSQDGCKLAVEFLSNRLGVAEDFITEGLEVVEHVSLKGCVERPNTW